MAYGQNTYWEEKGLHQEMANELNLLIPFMGSVENKRYRKKLERYRKAANAYYDIFNNGLMNRGNQLRVLGLKKYDLSLPNDYCRPDWDYNEEVVWNAFKPILLDAIVEQLK